MAISRDNTLEILIKTRAELEGAEAAAASLERQIGRAKALGKEYGGLEAQLRKTSLAIQASKAANADLTKSEGDLGAAHQETAKHAEFLGLKHQQLHKLVHQLGEAYPEAALAGRAFMNPVLLSLSLAIGVFIKAKEHLAELNAEMDKAGEAAAKPVVGLEAMRDAISATADDVYNMRVEYEKWTKALNERSGETTTNLTAETTALKEQVEAAKELLESKKNLALQRIEEDQNLTPEQKALRKFQIESASGTTSRKIDVDAGRAEVSKTTEAFAEVNKRFAEKLGEVDAAKTAAEDPHRIREIKTLSEQIKASDATEAEQKELAKNANDKYAKAQEALATVIKQWGGPGKDPSQWIGRPQQEAADKAKAQLDQHLGLSAEAKDQAEKSRDHQARLIAEQKHATDTLSELEGQAKTLKGEFDQLSIALDRVQRHQETAEKSSSYKASVDLAKNISAFIDKAPVAGKILVAGQHIAANSLLGKPVTDQERQALIQYASQIQGQPRTFDQARDYFTGITHRPAEREEAKESIDKRFLFAIEQLTARMEAMANLDRSTAANAGAHPGAPTKQDPNARFKQSLDIATGEVERAVTNIYLDVTTKIRELAKRIEANTKKGHEGHQ